MTKWSIITTDGQYRPVSPECDVENLMANAFRPRIIRRLVVHGLFCESTAANPCGQVYDTPAAANNAVTGYVGGPVTGVMEAPASRCTCPSSWEDRGGGYGELMIVEPDLFCPAHFEENHRMRELQAAEGYTRKTSQLRKEHPSVPTWQALPAAGKAMWRTWAECEKWDEDLG